jgi:hypothetical protein
MNYEIKVSDGEVYLREPGGEWFMSGTVNDTKANYPDIAADVQAAWDASRSIID